MNGTVQKYEEPKLKPIADIASSSGLRVCFVCTGNTCRSPMAAAALNHFGKPSELRAVSAGISPEPNGVISENAVRALELAGILPSQDNDYTSHKSRAVTGDLLENCDRIIAMTQRHTFLLISAFPQFASKIYTMPREITDPYGGTLDDYIKCLNEIIEALKELFGLECS